MPSQPHDTGWEFGSVIHLIDSDVHDIRSPTLRPTEGRPLVSALPDGGIHLGSFTKLYEDLGLSNVSQAEITIDPESELSNNSDDALLPSPILKDVEASQVPSSPIGDPKQSGDDTPIVVVKLSKKARKKARVRAEKQRLEEAAREQESQPSPEAPAETPSETPRYPLCSSVGAKIRSASPVPASKEPAPKPQEPTPKPQEPAPKPQEPAPKPQEPAPKPQEPALKPQESAPKPQEPTPQPQETKVSKTLRRLLKRRSSTAQPITSQVAQPVKSVPTTPIREAPEVPQASSPTPVHTQHMVLSTPGTFQTPHLFTPVGQHGLVPRTVRPVTVPRASQQPPSTPMPQLLPSSTPKLQPTNITIRSQVDRHFHFFNQLLHHFPDDRRWLLSPRQLVNENAISHGLHVFVDASNMMYGLKDALRYYGIYHPYQISFDTLALLMERRRPVAKRVYAGSHREANPLPQVTKILEDSRAVGYESNVKEQVFIVREASEKKRFFDDVKKVGWQKAQQMRSGSGSDSETGVLPPKTPAAPKWVEQGVDEILHLKMCQSIIDTEVPSVMVVATGDGAEAEMSDGFLAHVERALRKGWKVELVSWRQQLNNGYKNRKFRSKWADQFSIIELDDFLEDIIDTP